MRDRDTPPEHIEVRGIRAWGRHGASAGEQDVPQPIDVTVNLMVDVVAARTSDDLADTVDYAALHGRVVHIVETERHRLLERLATSVLDAMLDDARVMMAVVEIAKPELLGGATPKVTLSKMRFPSMKRAWSADDEGERKRKKRKKSKREKRDER